MRLIFKIVKYFADRVFDKPLQWGVIVAAVLLVMFWNTPIAMPIIGSISLGSIVLTILGFGCSF